MGQGNKNQLHFKMICNLYSNPAHFMLLTQWEILIHMKKKITFSLRYKHSIQVPRHIYHG